MDTGLSDLVEILLVDWNSKIPLKNDLALSDKAKKNCSIITIPEEIANKKMRSDQIFNIPCAANVGLRRSNAKYACIFSADMIMSKFSFLNLINLLDGKTLVPFQLDKTIFLIPTKRYNQNKKKISASSMEFDQVICLSSSQLVEAGLKWPGTGSGSITLMHTNLWNEFRGYDEALSDWGWNDIELPLRVTQKYPYCNLSFLGITAIDIVEPKNNIEIARKINPLKISIDAVTNDKNWGLGQYTFDKGKISNNRASKIPIDNNINRISSNELYLQINSDEVKDNCKVYWKKFNTPTIMDWEVLNIISWISLFNDCDSYLQVGVNNHIFPIMIGKSFPSANIYLIESWKNNLYHPKDISLRLTKNGFCGYLRYVSGQESTGIKRLSKNLNYNLSIDVAVIHLERLEEKSIENIERLIDLSSKNTFFLLVSNDHEKLSSITNDLKNSSNYFQIYFGKSNKVALIIKDQINAETKDSHQSGVIDFGSPPLLKKDVLSYWNHMLKFWRYPYYFSRLIRKW